MRIGTTLFFIFTAGTLLAASCGSGEDNAIVTPSLTATDDGAVPARVVEAPSTGGVPTFTMSAYQGEDILGGTTGIKSSEWMGRGRPVILYFWYADCNPCGNMALMLQKFYEANQVQALVVGVDVGPLIGEKDARLYLREQQITYPVGTIDGGKASLEEIVGFPTTLFISDQGELIRRQVGFLDWKTLLAFASEMSPGVRIVDAAPTGPGERIPDQGRDHVEPGEGHPAYNSVPGASGWHYGHPLAPADWGVYEEVLPDEVLMHNLEHGGIGVHYNCPEACQELVARLREIVTRARSEGKKVLMSPYRGMDTRIALTAWTFMDRFDEFDDQRIARFINAHESSLNAPEPFVR